VTAVAANAKRPVPALSDLSVREFLTLSRVGFLPHGLVVGSSVYDAGSGQRYSAQTGEVTGLSTAMRTARNLAVARMRKKAAALSAEGVVGVRLLIEHHRWRSGHTVAKFVALGTAIAFDHEHGPDELQGAPSLALSGGAPFTSDLSGQEFVALLRAGFRPVELAMGTCVYQLDPRAAAQYRQQNLELAQYTQAFFDAREAAMDRLQRDLFKEWPPGHADAPVGVVGMTVQELAHGGTGYQGPPVVEFTAVGTAVARLAENDPRRAKERVKPVVVVPLDT
jgi:uncharacterized protein YbjQ (UPF0145 family)